MKTTFTSSLFIKKTISLFVICLAFVNFQLFAQVTATISFENLSPGSFGDNITPYTKAFSSQTGSLNFVATGRFKANGAPGSSYGANQSTYYMDSGDNTGPAITAANIGGFTIQNASTSFKVNSFAAYTASSPGGSPKVTSNITFIGTKVDNTTVTETVTITPTNTGSNVQNGLTFIGNLANVYLTKLEVAGLPSGTQYLELDDINVTTQAITTNQFSINDVSLTEGNSGTKLFTFTVTETDNTAANSVQVQSSNGTATSGSDYVAFPLTTVNFTAGGAKTQTVSVTVNGDVTIENDETFTMTLSNASSGSVLFDATGIGTIVDDDAIKEDFELETQSGTTFSQSGFNFQSTGTLFIRQASGFGSGGSNGYLSNSTAGSTGNLGSVQITSPATSFNVLSVDLWTATVSGSAPNYTFTPSSRVVTFTGTKADGTGTVTATATVSPTTTAHIFVDLTLTALNGIQLSALSFSVPSATYVQIDNFRFGTSVISNTQLSINNVSILEGTGGGVTTAIFTITRTNNTSGFTVDVASSNGTATAGSDYTAFPSTTLTFANGGALSQNVSVNIIRDAAIESNETFNMTLSNATGGTLYLKQVGIGTILDDDQVIETFEDETANATTFTQNFIAFSATGGYNVVGSSGGTLGAGSSGFFLRSPNNVVGSMGTFSITTPNTGFKLKSLDAWVGTSTSAFSAGTVTFTGTLFGGGTVTTNKTITATNNTGTGWQQNITFTSTPLDNVLLTAIQVISTGALKVVDIDNFNYAAFSTFPVIEVTDASNVAITNGGVASNTNNTDFGGACVTGGTVSKTYTIKNTGQSNLTLSGSPIAVLGGADASQFSVTTQPTSPIVAGGSTTFTVVFDPSSAGPKNANITLMSNDGTNNPYLINIKGTGTNLSLTAASQTNILCFGGSNGAATVNTPAGGAGGYTYNWTPGNPTGNGTMSVSGLIAGTWTCTVTDANSCTASTSFTITQPTTSITLTAASQTNVSCNGGSNAAAAVNVATGGTAPYTYNWTPGNPMGDGTPSITGLTAGSWTCTVTDANLCAATSVVTITQPSAIVLNASSKTNVSCFGGSDGGASVNIATGGTAPYTYNWTPGNPTGDGTTSVAGLTAGIWTCTVTDANLCSAISTFSITSPSEVALTTSSQTNVSCFGGANGAAAVNIATGGAGGYTYNWTPGNPTGDGTRSVTGLTAGSWTCTVTDANNCSKAQVFTITEPSTISLTSASQTNVTCFGGNNGAASINTPTGGAGGYTYNWTPDNPIGDGTTSVSGLTAGSWTCTVTDANSCTAITSFTITQPSALNLTTGSKTDVTCFNSSNGTASVNVATGGTGPYSYNWIPGNPTGDGTVSVSGLSGGSYTCTVTDANSCTAFVSFSIVEPPQIQIPNVAAPLVLQVCQPNTLTFSGSCSSGNIVWSDNSTNGTLVFSDVGTYTVSAKCVLGLCESNSSTSITGIEIKVLPADPVVSAQNICSGSNYTLAATCPTTGSNPVWSTDNAGSNVISPNLVNVTASNTYYVSCMGSGPTSCNSAIVPVTLSVNSTLAYPISPIYTNYVYGCENGNVEVALKPMNLTGSPANFQWQISTGGAFSNLTEGGNYSGVTTDKLLISNLITGMNNYKYRALISNICNSIITDTMQLKVNQLPSIITQPIGQTVCVGNQTTLSVVADGTGVSYQWQVDNGSGFANISNNANYNNVNSANLLISNIPNAFNNYQYRCVIFNSCLSINSGNAVIQVDPTITILGQPANRTVCQNSSVSLTVSAVHLSTGSITYQWQLSNNNGLTYSNISDNSLYSGVNTSTLNLTNIPANLNGARYRCLMNNYCQSMGVLLTVTPIATVVAQPAPVEICVGNNANFSILAEGIGLTYRWQLKTSSSNVFVNVVDGGIYQGATTNTLQLFSPSGQVNNNQYRCLVWGTSSCDVKADSSMAALITIGSSAEANIINWNSPISTNVGVSQAISYILGINNIMAPNGNAEYRAGNSILLNPGFEVQAGAIFKAIIRNPCQTTIMNNINSNTSIPKEITK